MSKNKSQISIFVLIALFIIILLVFLIFSSFKEKEDDLQIEENKFDNSYEDMLNFAGKRVDYCLERQIKRAAITSGLRGGFIYDKDEYYFGGVIPDDTFNQVLFSNLNLSWDELTSKSMVLLQSHFYVPGIESSVQIYNHSIEEDFERFITYEFMKCIDFEDFEDVYDINYTDYLGKLEYDPVSNRYFATGLDAKEGDLFELEVGYGKINGTIGSMVDDRYNLDFSDESLLTGFSASESEDMGVLNLNRSLELNLTFNYENIVADISYPVDISYHNYYFYSYKDSRIIVPIRFKAILSEGVRALGDYKYLVERDANYLDYEVVKNALNRSNYFKREGISSLKLVQTTLKDEMEHKKYIYSLIDYDSKIQGIPFVFNFGYENIAPRVNFSEVDSEFVVNPEDNSILLFASEGVSISYNLNQYIDEDQFNDNYIYYFKEMDESSPSADFSLTAEGELNFIARDKSIYRYDVVVTDGEAKRVYPVVFFIGFPDNTNNEALKDCIKFDNKETNRFPVHNDFKELEDYIGADGYHNYYGYYVHNSYVTNGFDLFFKSGCFIPNGGYELKVVVNGVENTQSLPTDGSNHKIENLDSLDQKIEIDINVINSDGTEMINEDFHIELYPAQCLGTRTVEIEGVNADLSCCDLSQIDSDIASDTPRPMLNNVESGTFAIDDELYVALDVEENSNYFQNNVVWADYGNSITSLYKTHVRVKCGGDFPRWEDNVDENNFIGGLNLGYIQKIEHNNYEGTPPNPMPKLKVDEVTAGSMCNFGYVLNSTGPDLIMDNGDLVFESGFVAHNPGTESGVSPIPSGDEYDNLYLLCDDRYYASEDAGINWGTSSGIGRGDRGIVYKSRGFCALDDTVCEGRIGSPGSGSGNDIYNGLKCKDSYFNGISIISVPEIVYCSADATDCDGGFICNYPPPPEPECDPEEDSSCPSEEE